MQFSLYYVYQKYLKCITFLNWFKMEYQIEIHLQKVNNYLLRARCASGRLRCSASGLRSICSGWTCPDPFSADTAGSGSSCSVFWGTVWVSRPSLVSSVNIPMEIYLFLLGFYINLCNMITLPGIH